MKCHVFVCAPLCWREFVRHTHVGIINHLRIHGLTCAPGQVNTRYASLWSGAMPACPNSRVHLCASPGNFCCIIVEMCGSLFCAQPSCFSTAKALTSATL